MASSLFNNQRNGLNGAFSGATNTNVLNSFNQFRQGISPWNAEQQVKSLLASGKMTQQQYRQLSQMAQGFMKYLK